MPDPLVAQLVRLAEQVRSARQVMMFTDFDGTLVPIKDRPTECFLDPALGRTLSALAGHEHVTVGIVSGRELEDLRNRVGVDNIIYAGNHGLEIEGPGFVFRELNAVSMINELKKLLENLGPALAGFPGAWVQDKGLSASVHYRQVVPADVLPLLDVVHRVAAPFLAAQQVVLRSGKKVLEIRPAVDWHKGKAVGWLVRRMSIYKNPLLIYFGDDNTDEDVFAAWPGEITVCVGEKQNTSANYTVRDPAEVHAILSWLQGLIAGSIPA